MIRLVFRSLKRNKVKFIITIFVMMITNMLSLLMNVMNQRIFDIAFYNRNIQYLVTHGIYMIISIYIIILVLGIVTKKLSADLFANSIAIIRSEFLENVINSEYLFF